MRAIVTRPFKGKDNHSPRCIQYKEGQEIDDPIATTAVSMGRARSLGKVAPANKVMVPSENKAEVHAAPDAGQPAATSEAEREQPLPQSAASGAAGARPPVGRTTRSPRG